LKYVKAVAKLAFNIGNSYGLHENDLGLLRVYCQQFFTIAFSDALFQHYFADNRKAEQIISFGLSFFASLLEHPGVWDTDILSPNDPDTGAQEWIEQNIFTCDLIS